MDRPPPHARGEGDRARDRHRKPHEPGGGAGELRAGADPGAARVRRDGRRRGPAVRRRGHRRGYAGQGARDEAVGAAPRQGRMGGRAAAGRDRRDGFGLRGRGPGAAGGPFGERALPGGHLRAAGATRREQPRLLVDRRRRPARDDPALDPQHGCHCAGRTAAHGHGRGEPPPLHGRCDADAAGERTILLGAARDLRDRVPVAAGRYRHRGAGGSVRGRGAGLQPGAGRGPARPGAAAVLGRRGAGQGEHDPSPVDAARLRPHAGPRCARLLTRAQGDVPRRQPRRGLCADGRAGTVLPGRGRPGAFGAAWDRRTDRGRRARDGHRLACALRRSAAHRRRCRDLVG